MKKIIPVLLTSTLLAASLPATAQNDAASHFEFHPLVIDSSQTNAATAAEAARHDGSSVGVLYKFSGDLLNKPFAAKDSGDSFNANATLGAAVLSYNGRGIVTAASDRNPRDFQEFGLDGKLRYSAAGKGSVLGGLFVKLETNQRLSRYQMVLGLAASYGKYGVLRSNDFIGVDLNYAHVSPHGDYPTMTGGSPHGLDTFYRANMELLWMIPIESNMVKAVELNYRHFQTHHASRAVMDAGQDRQNLSTVRIGLKNDMFVAWGNGRLPFDQISKRMVQIGFSYQL